MPAFEKTFSDKEIQELAEYVVKAVAAEKGQITSTNPQKYAVDTVVTGLDIPWGLCFLPDGDMLITERSGKLHRFSNGKLSAPLQGVPEVFASNQGGLLDIALHPDYDNNGWIYISYSSVRMDGSTRKSNTAIMRARLEGNSLKDQQVIFQAEPVTTRGHHFGCKLAFDKDNNLFFGVGDRGQHFDFPQKLDNHNGKIHRIRDDGSIPPDNPFVNTPGAMPSIYSYGHRNPQGTSFHPETGQLWESEHGPRGGDELNLIRPGLNYGWPVISYGINYDGTVLTELTKKEGMEQPVHYWTPSIAPCGMTFVTGDRYPGWKNNILLGSLSFRYLERVVLENNQVVRTEKLLEDVGRVRNVVMSPDGYIYVAVESPGRILRLRPLE
jgi:aldose sugar dehydrogenase